MDRPTGTVTFLFTDIEGSTPLWERWPKDMAVAVAEHDRIVREVASASGGVVFAATGDGFGIAFWRPDTAATAAGVLQERLRQERLRQASWPTPAPIKSGSGSMWARQRNETVITTGPQ